LLHLTNSRQFKGHLFGNRDELRFVMQESGGGLSSEETQMINRVLDLQNLTVRHVMIPLANTVTVKQRDTLGELLRLAREKHTTRLPVWDAALQPPKIIGIASLNNVLFKGDVEPSKLVKDFVKPALYLDGEVRLEVALQRMQRAGQRLAIVLGRDQREIGVVSLQDILKFIFGEVSL
jgi:CBS domain containing-hemolysin-like protein